MPIAFSKTLFRLFNYLRNVQRMRFLPLLFYLTAFFTLCSPRSHAQKYRSTELLFLENKGQWPQQVRFRASVGSHSLWLESNRITYQLVNSNRHPLNQLHAERNGETPDTSSVLAHVYQVIFKNSSTRTITSQSAALPTSYNFFVGNNERKWATGVHSFEKVQYTRLYPGINLSLYGNKGAMKYDFELEAGNDGSQISMEYAATHGLRIEHGKLIVKTALGKVEEHIPKAYQLVNGIAVPVECQFILNNNVVSFGFPKGLNKRYPTVIDPVLAFFTYSGSFDDNWANTAVSDSAGNSYTAGTVYGSNYPTTLGVYDREYNSAFTEDYLGYDVGILKFNPTGSQLIWCTFLGGRAAETPHALEIDKNQNLLVMGTTSSSNFPTTDQAFSRTFKGGPAVYPFGQSSMYIVPTYLYGSDVFLSRIRLDGKVLMASTFLGGTGTDGLMDPSEPLVTNYGDQFRGDIQTGADGSIYLVSTTHSTNYPTQPSSNTGLRGNCDGIVTKLSPDLSQLIWSRYIGGNDDDALYSLTLTKNGDVAVCGGTTSTNFPTTTFAHQTTGPGRSIDGVIALLNPANGSIVAATYTATPAYDQAFLVATDDENNIFVFGQTAGQMPFTQGVYGQAKGGQFVQKFNPNLSGLTWGTTFGSVPFRSNVVPTAFMVDSCDRIFIAGWGGRTNYTGPGFTGAKTFGLPITADAFRSVSTDSSDFYFLVLGANARSLVFGSYFGSSGGKGEHVDGGTSHFDRRGIITQAVCGCYGLDGSFFQGTQQAYRPNIGSSNCNNGVMKVNLLDLKARFDFTGKITCPATLTVTNRSENGQSYIWYFGNGDSLVSNNTVIQYTYAVPGTYVITLKALNPQTCRQMSVAYDTVEVPDPFPHPPTTQTGEYCVGDSLFPVFEDYKDSQVQWIPPTYVSDPTSYKPVITPLSRINYKIRVKNAAGCIQESQYITRNRKIDLGFASNQAFNECTGVYTVTFSSNRDTSDRYLWFFHNGDSAVGKTITRIYTQNGNYVVRLNGIKGDCEDNAIDTLRLTDQLVIIEPHFTVQRKYTGCDQPSWVFKNQTPNAQAYLWDFGDGYKSTEPEPEHTYAEPGTYRVTLQGFQHSCSELFTKELLVDKVEIPNLITQNDDTKNEAFFINGLQPGWGLDVFNRWGVKLYHSDSYDNTWVPKSVQEGVYFYIIQFPGGAHCNGWVDVIK